MTALKQMTMPSISTAMIGSPSVMQLIREMKRGAVCPMTMTSEIGAIDTATHNSMKLSYPVTNCQKILFCVVREHLERVKASYRAPNHGEYKKSKAVEDNELCDLKALICRHFDRCAHAYKACAIHVHCKDSQVFVIFDLFCFILGCRIYFLILLSWY